MKQVGRIAVHPPDGLVIRYRRNGTLPKCSPLSCPLVFCRQFWQMWHWQYTCCHRISDQCVHSHELVRIGLCDSVFLNGGLHRKWQPSRRQNTLTARLGKRVDAQEHSSIFYYVAWNIQQLYAYGQVLVKGPKKGLMVLAGQTPPSHNHWVTTCLYVSPVYSKYQVGKSKDFGLITIDFMVGRKGEIWNRNLELGIVEIELEIENDAHIIEFRISSFFGLAIII
ncbi:hypothetical protein OUZ56_002851 [Daphnia magna]|uniref:Uncharacterized protein n=1 Tax=Daphnia magna TaxID=35525 RepID=A0ABR0A7A9_9CRUS|nr:hypothetical protein OUZ56_002851 [Daphnia magna]